MASLASRYVGPPVCRLKSTWKAAPFCDGCGGHVEKFKVWFDNRRHCSAACRPAWHLVPAQVCKLPGCGERVIRGSGLGRPGEFCTDEHRREARAEDTRRRRAGEPSIDKEVRGDPALRSVWMPRVSEWDMDEFPGFHYVGENGRPVHEWRVESRSLREWLCRGGDWPNMVSEGGPVSGGVMPTLGCWHPWNQPCDLRCRKNAY